MALSPGTRIGPYEVAALIGAGGMGEVYRATDTNLKRSVAITVLPESLASNADRLARFQRGAEVLASLNHHNIAQIHGLERGPAEAGHYAQGNTNGRELIYLQGDDVMSVAVNDSSSAFTFSPALRLFAMRTPLKTQPPSYDVAADGSLLMLKPIPIVRAPLEVVLDWRGMIGRPAAVTTDH